MPGNLHESGKVLMEVAGKDHESVLEVEGVKIASDQGKDQEL